MVELECFLYSKKAEKCTRYLISQKLISLCMKVWVYMHAQSHPTLWDPMDSSLPGASVHGILQPRILEWFAISFSKGSSWPRDWTSISCVSCIGRRILYHCTTWEAWQVWRLDFLLSRKLTVLDHTNCQGLYFNEVSLTEILHMCMQVYVFLFDRGRRGEGGKEIQRGDLP